MSFYKAKLFNIDNSSKNICSKKLNIVDSKHSANTAIPKMFSQLKQAWATVAHRTTTAEAKDMCWHNIFERETLTHQQRQTCTKTYMQGHESSNELAACW